MSVIDSLITDRTQADVNRVYYLIDKWFSGTITPEERAEWSGDLKGAYNASDLNRVGTAITFISEKLSNIGLGHRLEVKTDWIQSDDALPSKLDYYLKSIKLLKDWFYAVKLSEPPESLNGLTFSNANDIERMLVELDKYIKKINDSYYFSNEIYSGEVNA